MQSLGSLPPDPVDLSGLTRRASVPRFKNFDLIRLFAASCVIFSHAFGIVDGNENAEPLVTLLGHGNIVGLYGVFTFFIISGFLITASFEHSGLPEFLIKRCLRIFPGLIACAVLTTLVAMIASGGIMQLDALKAGASYALRTSLLLNTSAESLPGVVFSSNDFGRIFNGSLWSLGQEFLCYLAVAALGLGAMLDLRTAMLLLGVGLYTHNGGLLGQIGYVLPFFAAGAVLHFWRARPVLGWRTFMGAVAGLVLAGLFGIPSLGFALFGAWLIVSLATAPVQIGGATRFGDLSYGIYLYGWPVEQTLRYALGPGATWWLVFLLTLPVAAVIALVSWHLVEAPSIRFGRSPLFDPVKAFIGRMTANTAAAARSQPVTTPPHIALKPRVFPDGAAWCCLYGDSPDNGVAGFGRTPSEAASAFDRAWLAAPTPDAARPEMTDRPG